MIDPRKQANLTTQPFRDLPQMLDPDTTNPMTIVYVGGRGSGKTINVGRTVLNYSVRYENKNIFCLREIQKSITMSIHPMLVGEARQMGTKDYFHITENKIITKTGSVFRFTGFRHNIESILSAYKADIVLIDEAQSISQRSLDILLPTVRESGSKIIFIMNPRFEHDAVYKTFVLNEREGVEVRKVNWRDNPFFGGRMDIERRTLLKHDPSKYQWVWEGELMKIGERQIFKFTVEDFDVPTDAVLYQGLDWGFVASTIWLQFFVKDKTIYICDELQKTEWAPQDFVDLLKETRPDARRWITTADSASPEHNLLLKRAGFRVKKSIKGANSVVDGIEYLQGYSIVIHPKCEAAIYDFSNYEWQVDKMTDEVIPRPEKKNDHAPDALRYGIETLRRKAGSLRKPSVILNG